MDWFVYYYDRDLCHERGKSAILLRDESVTGAFTEFREIFRGKCSTKEISTEIFPFLDARR